MTDVEIKTFMERMEEIGDDWEKEDVKRVYGDYTFEDALTDRMNDIHMYADIVGKVINR